MGFFSLKDAGFLKGKIDSINPDSLGFGRTTIRNSKHYGSKFVDCFAIAAGLCYIIPLIISVYKKDSGENNNNRDQGKTRRR